MTSFSRIAAIIAVAAGLMVASPANSQAPTVTAFVNVSVIPMDRERVLSGQTVVVRGDRIVALGPTAQVPIPAGATRIDGHGKFLLPGLADMHVHLAVHADTANITDVLFAFVANGVTTVRDMHSGGRRPLPGYPLPDTWRLALRRRIASGAVLGPRLYTAGDPDLASPAAAARSVAELKADGNDFVKIAFYDDRWPAMQAVYDSIMATAHRVGLRVVGHVPPGLPVPQVLAAHWASTEHLYEYVEDVLGLAGRWSFTDGGILANLEQHASAYVDTAVWMRPGYRLDSVKLHDLAVATQRAGVWNCPTLALMHVSKEAALQQTPEVRVAERFDEFYAQVTRALQDAGAGLLVGTDVSDGGRLAPGFSVHLELQALVAAGLTPYQALVAATRNPAAFLGTLDSTGTIAVGKRADLVLLSGNPLTDIGYTAGPAGVMVGGRWLARADIDARLTAMQPPTPAYAGFYTLVNKARQEIWRH